MVCFIKKYVGLMIMPILAIIGIKSGDGPHVKPFAGFQLQLIFSLFACEETDSSGVFVS
ncbi:MAG: hypothetical protein ACK5E4_06635 [Planctomycetia bacterium]